MFRPADSLFAGTPTALQLKMYFGELLGTLNRGLEIVPHLRSKSIDAGLSWAEPVYGFAEPGKYHVAGEDVLIDAGYVARVPFVEKLYQIDLPFTLNGFIPSFDEFQTHYDARAPFYRQIAEKHARTSDMKAGRMLIKAARAAANIPAGGAITAGCETPAGLTIVNAAMLTSATVLMSSLQTAAQTLDENDVPALGRKVLLHPVQFWNLVNNRELLDRDVTRENGDFADGTVYKAFGIQLIKSNAIKAVRTAGNYAGVTGEVNSYIANFSNNAGVVFTEDSVLHLLRKALELQMWYEKPRFGTVITTRVIDGFGITRPEATIELATS